MSPWVKNLGGHDDKLLATASDNQTIILWHVETLTPLGEPFSYHDAAINTLAFNPNGTLLASGDANNAVILWDVAKQKMVGIPLEGHTNEVLSVAFNHDGTLLASGSADNFIILWNVESQTPTGPPLTGHLNAITTVNFSPDGKRLVSGSRDSNIILWDVNLEPWQERACHIANRNLTEEEWDHFIGSTPAYRLTCPHLPSPPEVNLTANSG